MNAQIIEALKKALGEFNGEQLFKGIECLYDKIAYINDELFFFKIAFAGFGLVFVVSILLVCNSDDTQSREIKELRERVKKLEDDKPKRVYIKTKKIGD